jgi:hypothetical protein
VGLGVPVLSFGDTCIINLGSINTFNYAAKFVSTFDVSKNIKKTENLLFIMLR